MMNEPDYVAWLSHEALSPHEFACLILGVEPTPLPPNGSACPAMPEEAGDYLDLREWEVAYMRVQSVLSRAMEEGGLPVTPGGRIKLADGMTYLISVAGQPGWSEQLTSSPFIEQAKAKIDKDKSGHEDALAARIEMLEDELARCKASGAYSTPMLEMVQVVIEHFYVSGGDYPKQEVVFEFLRAREKLSDGTKLSQSKIESIWAVASHPDQAKGGQKPRKKS